MVKDSLTFSRHGQEVLRQLSKFFLVSIDYIIGENSSDESVLNNELDSYIGENKIPYNIKSNYNMFKRPEFDSLTHDEIDKLAEYAEFLKSKRHKKDN